MAITLGLVEAVDDNGVYVTMPGSRGVLRGPYKALSTVAAGTTVLVASTDDGEQVVVGASPSGVGAVSVLSFGAVGDGVADDTDAVQAAVNAAAGIASVHFPAGTFKITAPIAVPANSQIVGSPGADVVQSTSGAAGLRLTGDNIRIESLTLTGRHTSSTYVAGEYAIITHGTSAAGPVRNIRVSGCTLNGWGYGGVRLDHSYDFLVNGCTIDEAGYAGVVVVSCVGGQIVGNAVSNVTAGTSGNSYGIAATRISSSSLSTDPRSSDVFIAHNTLTNIRWEALDTHGGERITFHANTIVDCDRGVAVVDSPNGSAVSTYAPLQCVVSNNLIDSGVDDGSRWQGVIFYGAGPGSGTAVEYGTGVVVGNVIRRHGGEGSGGLLAAHTRGLAVVGNRFEECNPYGVIMSVDDLGFAVTGNTMVDVWNDASASAAAVLVSDGCTGSVTGNVLSAGVKSGVTYLNDIGLYDFGGTAGGVEVQASGNDFAAASSPFYSPGATDTSTLVGYSSSKVGFFGAAPGGKPTVSGSRGGNAALQSLLTELATLGLITDSSS